jgi:hypothetical protein
MGKCIERDTVHGHEDQSGKTGTRIEFNPMNIVIVGHRSPIYSLIPLASFILLIQLSKNHYRNIRTMGGLGKEE